VPPATGGGVSADGGAGGDPLGGGIGVEGGGIGVAGGGDGAAAGGGVGASDDVGGGRVGSAGRPPSPPQAVIEAATIAAASRRKIGIGSVLERKGEPGENTSTGVQITRLVR
jgi:hypothetical protein